MDASEGEVFLAVYHNENFTNLYISDEAGIYYSLTLEDVITNGELYWNSGDEKFDVHVVWIDKTKYIRESNLLSCVYIPVDICSMKLRLTSMKPQKYSAPKV